MTDQNPWIPVDEMLPQPWQLVMVWTDYNFPNHLVDKWRSYPTCTIATGWIDDCGRWHVQAPSDVAVIFWSAMPPPPPGQTYPRLKNGVSPAGRQLPAEANA